MKKITSVNNELIKELSKLKQKKYRDERKEFLVEGYHLVEEARQFLKLVLIVDEKDEVKGVENILVTEDVIKKLSSTITPQNIIGVCRYFSDEDVRYSGKIILLDNLQDPGNIGTIIRSSLGFNVDLVVLSKGSCDIYNDKLIRSTQGALFKVRVIEEDLVDAIKKIKASGVKVFGTSLQNGTPLEKIEKVNNYALILGNEGNGVRKELLEITDKNIYIEIDERLESLNVSVASGIIMHYFYK